MFFFLILIENIISFRSKLILLLFLKKKFYAMIKAQKKSINCRLWILRSFFARLVLDFEFNYVYCYNHLRLKCGPARIKNAKQNGLTSSVHDNTSV